MARITIITITTIAMPIAAPKAAIEISVVVLLVKFADRIIKILSYI